jgi:glyoxylate/hydroxypyruvate reductase A
MAMLELPVQGVYLAEDYDLEADFGQAIGTIGAGTVALYHPSAVKAPEAIRFALCWRPGRQAFAPYVNLEFAMGAGAGVDALLSHPGLAGHVAVCRVRDDFQARQMAGYALHEILHVERRFPEMERHARQRRWIPLPPRDPRQVRVAVLGAGTMGREIARAAAGLGFQVRMASRRPVAEPLPGVEALDGQGAIDRAAQEADFLINVLPLTSDTADVLNAALLAQMARGGWLIQIGRGEHLVEADLLAALDSGQLAGATLDVARDEPLPADHPFWQRPELRITPHIASSASAEAVACQLVDCVHDITAGLPPRFAVDRSAGY